MNLNQIVNMLTRMLSRRAVNWGLRKARQSAAKSGSGAKPSTPQSAQEREHRAAVKRARQAARLTRRIGR